MIPREQSAYPLWIVGYGNPHRRDDGIGPYVVQGLRPLLADSREIRTLACRQLEPGIVETLRDANSIVFIDACIHGSGKGWEWTTVKPELRDVSYLTHHCKPSFLLGLLGCIYGRAPISWVISVEGDDFGLGEGLTRGAEQRACMVVAELVNWLTGTVLHENQGKDSSPFGGTTGEDSASGGYDEVRGVIPAQAAILDER